MRSTLRLFRRHGKTCSEGYRKDFRIVEADSLQTTKKPQCSCTISAEGTLLADDGTKTYLRPTSTGENVWAEAYKKIGMWEKWGGIKAPEPPATPQTAPAVQQKSDELVKVADAVERYYENLEDNGTDSNQHRQLLTLRLLPFAENRKVTFIQEMDSAQIWADFRHSWKNENPTHNRKPKPEELGKTVSLAKSTESRLIQQLRSFHRFCLSREWLSDVWSSKDHKMYTSFALQAKEPFTDLELEYVYRAADLVTDGKGFKQKRIGTENGKEDRIFAYVLRYTGLRISDVTTLEASHLVPFESGCYSHAIHCNPQKTEDKESGNFVFIPIPNGKIPGDPNLVSMLQSLPLKHGRFFFLGGGPLPERGTKQWKKRIRQATKARQARINRLFTLAAKLMKDDGVEFAFHPHPHRFRHTFAATLLRGGMSLREVAAYLGDTEEVVRRHYAKFCVAEQREAAEKLEEVMRKRAEEFRQLQKARMLAASVGA